MKTLVAVYSYSGHTLRLAETLKAGLDADLARIVAHDAYSYGARSLNAFFRRKVPIDPCQADLGGYDLLVLCCPVWYNSPPAGVNEYVAGLRNARGKRFAVALTTGGSGVERTIRLLREDLEALGMAFSGAMALRDTEVDAGRLEGPALQFVASVKGEA